MNKNRKLAVVGVSAVLGAATVFGAGFAIAATVTPGAAGQPVHVCYSESGKKVPNMFVQFRTQNFGKCGAGYKHFVIQQPQDAGINVNGPYPGATQLSGTRANSTAKWTADEGATMQRSWVKCAAGEVATGGGFSTADESLEAKKGMQVLNSSPAQIDANGNVTTITGGYTPIAGDPDGAFKPNGWVVEGVNNNQQTDLIVRPFAVCGKG